MRSIVCVLAAWAVVGCDDGGSEATGDCREAARACAAGFVCVAGVGGVWTCEPGRPADGAVDDDMAASGPDLAVPDAATPDAAEADAATPDAAAPDAASPEAVPGGACGEDLPCLSGTCRDDLPGGFCRVACADDAACAPEAACAGGVCRSTCADLPCRAGWACDATGAVAVCVPHCGEVGCMAPQVCDASGLCVAPCVDETCNDKDDDCDGQVDEGVVNGCGGCGEVPAEVCNEADDDCDGTADEGLQNACGGCGEVPAEVCDADDNDCDGTVDEGVLNACGTCEVLPPEACDGQDSDCDGRVDEAAVCPAGEACLMGACRRPPSEPGGPCRVDADCRVGTCEASAEFPGGWCVVGCAGDADCGAEARCVNVGENYCLEACGDGCRAGWVCYEGDDACFPHCRNIGCNEGYVCENTGFCEIPNVVVTLGQVFLSPGVTADNSTWDGFGSVPDALMEAAVTAVLGPSVLNGVVAFFAGAALGAFDAPDPYGTVTLDGDGFDLGEIADTYTPLWNGVTWRVALDPARDIRLVLDLTDADLANDDPIGRVEIGSADLRAALAAGQQYGVATVRQGVGHILAVSISVRLQ